MKANFLFLCGALAGFSGVGCGASDAGDSTPPVVDGEEADSLAQTATFYVFSRDGQKLCPGSLCNGDYLKRVNFSTTKCADGNYSSDCYVHKVDYAKLGLGASELKGITTAFENGHVLIRGKMRTGKLDDGTDGVVLTATEAWLGNAGSKPEGTFYRVNDQGVACLVAPCPSLHEAKLNSTIDDELFDIEFPQAAATAVANAKLALKTKDGLLAVGSNFKKDGLLALKATEFYTRVQPKADAPVCPAASATVRYVSQDLMKCAAIMFSCNTTETMFSNACGCGCALLE